jgi:hypothetical protein
MQWFKHHNNFRNTPAMRYIDQMLGDEGTAGVYRLYEVFTERFAVDNDFSGGLLLSPPTSEQWLADEVLRRPEGDDNPYGNGPSLKQLQYFLSVCERAGIVSLKRQESACFSLQDDGTTEEDGKNVWTTVTIPGFADLADEYASRKKKGKALETTR